MSPSSATIEYETQQHRVGLGDSLIFGRGAQLDLDCNRFLSRQEGRIYGADGLIWVQNLSGRTPISVRSLGVSITLTASTPVPLTAAESLICLDAGSCTYEIRAHLDGAIPSGPSVGAQRGDGASTQRSADIPLTNDQMLLVLVLAEGQLREPLRIHALPSNAEGAASLGWSVTRFNRKLDWLCSRLHQLGVPGMKGRENPDGSVSRANGRRQRVVDSLIGAGVVTAEHLTLLDEHRSHL